MVCPAAFGHNAQTAASNGFQHEATESAEFLRAESRGEARDLALALEAAGIAVHLAEDLPVPACPDAVFPNNWVSFHADGTVVLYPMLAPNRRLERREALVAEACERLGFVERRRIDMTAHERDGRYLEGTGSLVLDHVQRVAYAALSARTDRGLVEDWARQMDYEPLCFDARDERGEAYYHTNVLLWIGTRAAVLCSEALPAPDRERVRARLRASGRDLLVIDRTLVRSFAGNLLELEWRDDEEGSGTVLAMSAAARAAMPAGLLRHLQAAVDAVVAVQVPTIERIGGGSVRCMLAEVPVP
ncbi:MAG: hypothetical protein RL684_1382, partial [Pseudomonadota bacterium]